MTDLWNAKVGFRIAEWGLYCGIQQKRIELGLSAEDRGERSDEQPSFLYFFHFSLTKKH
jgi:hypothetical protein